MNPIRVIEGSTPGWEGDADDAAYYVNRRPFHYWPDHNLIMLHQPGTHHEVLEEDATDYEQGTGEKLPIERPHYQGEVHLYEHAPPEWNLPPEEARPQVDYNVYGKDPNEADVLGAIQQVHPGAVLRPKYHSSSMQAAIEKYSNEPPGSMAQGESDWDTGLCGEYAMALRDLYPHLQLGMYGEKLNDGWWPQHMFAHDGTHLYDVTGKRPLKPYLDDPNTVVELNWNHEPRPLEFLENGGEQAVERAKDFIRDHQ
jgi:hypothetical protein